MPAGAPPRRVSSRHRKAGRRRLPAATLAEISGAPAIVPVNMQWSIVARGFHRYWHPCRLPLWQAAFRVSLRRSFRRAPLVPPGADDEEDGEDDDDDEARRVFLVRDGVVADDGFDAR